MEETNTNIETAEQTVDYLQVLGLIPGPQKYYVQLLSANAGLVTSLSDLINKIGNGTDTDKGDRHLFL